MPHGMGIFFPAHFIPITTQIIQNIEKNTRINKAEKRAKC